MVNEQTIADPSAVFRRQSKKHNLALLNFYKAAALFYESKVWVGLSATQHREFGLSKPLTSNHHPNPLNIDANAVAPTKPPYTTYPIGQPVLLCGIQSSTFAHYNGRRGEIIGNPSSTSNSGSDRFQVRVCHDGKRMRLKGINFHVNTEFSQWGIVKICGADGHSGGSITVHQCYADLFNRNDPNNPPHMDDFLGTVLQLEFYDPRELVGIPEMAKILAQHRRLKAPLAQAPAFQAKDGFMRENFFPVASALGPTTHTFKVEDYEKMEAALRSAVTFLEDHLYQHRVPPSPHPNGYTFRPITTEITLREGLTCICAFPHSELDQEHRKWCSCPQFVRCGAAARPSQVKSVGQAVLFHEAALAGFERRSSRVELLHQCVDTRDHTYAQHLYGLANALWETTVLDNVLRAVEIVKCLFNFTAYYKNTVKDFLLDLLLETGQWEETVKYLNLMPHNESEIWLFSSALVWYRARGSDSSTAQKALVRAMQFNKFIAPRLLGIMETDKSQTKGWNEMYTMSVFRNEDGSVNNDGVKKPMASEYIRNYKKHWVLDKGALSFLQKVYDEEQGTTAKKKKKKKKREKTEQTNSYGSQVDGGAIPPSESKTLCAACGKFGKLSKCSGCKVVSYCSKECQVGDWKKHKIVCKKNRGKKE
jgi:hypothetical protein